MAINGERFASYIPSIKRY